MPRKVMVVADPTRESAAALQYALSHEVVEQDALILLHVSQAHAWRKSLSSFKRHLQSVSGHHHAAAVSFAEGSGSGGGGGDTDLLEAMKHVCEVSQPNLTVEVKKVEMDGKEKAAVILQECSFHSVDLLVVGQRRRLSNVILGQRKGGSFKVDTAEYLIENSKCTCISVQKKGQNAGYLLSTKTHKNFWLLA